MRFDRSEVGDLHGRLVCGTWIFSSSKSCSRTAKTQDFDINGQFFTRWSQEEVKTPLLASFLEKLQKYSFFRQTWLVVDQVKVAKYDGNNFRCIEDVFRCLNVKNSWKTIFFSVKVSLWTTDLYIQKCCFFHEFLRFPHV